MELQALKLYLMSKYSVERIDALFWEMQMIILRALLAVQPSIIHDKHCFELYGRKQNLDHFFRPHFVSYVYLLPL